MEGDVINVMGYDVSPVEVEASLRLHPVIEEAAVIGVPDAYLGQTIKAFVSLKPGAQATPKEIIAFCKAQMPRHQYPRQVEIVDEFPKSEAGEILRYKLRAGISSATRSVPALLVRLITWHTGVLLIVYHIGKTSCVYFGRSLKWKRKSLEQKLHQQVISKVAPSYLPTK